MKVIAAVLLLFGLTYFVGLLRHLPPESLEDFSALYCGSRLAAAHTSPYDARRLGACERTVAPWRSAASTMPAPYPPYALMLISPLCILPFNVAGVLWLLGIVASIALSCVLIARVAGAPLVVAVAAFACAMLFPSMIATSIEAYPVLFLVLAAYCLKQERWTYAAIALGASMIKPNLALPACVAAFAFLPLVRWRLLAVGAALFVAQSFFAGPRLFFAYFPYLRAYTAFDPYNAWQYSLVYLLHMAGLSQAFAVRAGWVQYALLCVAGAIAGALLARRFSDGAWIVLTPLAFAVVGGIYSRQQELAAAIPFALALAYRAQSQLARLAVVLLATPWSAVYGDAAYPPFAMLTTGTLVHEMWRPPRIVTVLAAFVAVAVLLAFPNGSVSSNSLWFLRHLPGWLGLVALVVACVAVLVEGKGAELPQASV